MSWLGGTQEELRGLRSNNLTKVRIDTLVIEDNLVPLFLNQPERKGKGNIPWNSHSILRGLETTIGGNPIPGILREEGRVHIVSSQLMPYGFNQATIPKGMHDRFSF